MASSTRPESSDSSPASNGGNSSNTSGLLTPTSTSSSRPPAVHAFTAPHVTTMNGHFAAANTKAAEGESFEHGIQVIDENKLFTQNLPAYFELEGVLRQGFNYHIISVFGSQSTGKSTLLNALFGTGFGVMSESERRQTTKGIWMSKNKQERNSMAENILVMDVEGTDGRERGEDQDFERKSALFALATSEVLIVNIWEHQVGLYQGANMGLLKTVFEVNLGLFLKSGTVPRSLLFFVIRDHIGNTPLSNLRATLLADLARIWSTLSKPPGLENSKIEDYFDFAFAALPHKILQPDAFIASVHKLGSRFREGTRRKDASLVLDEQNEPVLFPEYHRRIPADGFSHYASGIWDQIESNKDLDLPTQQELLAQFRCDEIAREVLVAFDELVLPLESRQTDASKSGSPTVIPELGMTLNQARKRVLEDFKVEASRYHQGVYKRKSAELESQIDGRLKILFKGQITAIHKSSITTFTDAVTAAVKAGQKKGTNYDFQSIVKSQKSTATSQFEDEAKRALITGAAWSEYQQELNLFRKDLDTVSAQLRKDELRRLATRVERWVRSSLSEQIGVQFNRLGSGRAGSGAPEHGTQGSEKDLWDRIWHVFTEVVSHASDRFSQRAASLDASPEEVSVGVWRLKRKSWGVLRAKIDEEVMEGNLMLKLRENFEDRFRYDDEGVPRIWRPTDDIEGLYTKARESTLELIPLLSKFKLQETHSFPDLEEWVGGQPESATAADEEDLAPIGGLDDEEGGKTLEQEMTILSEAKQGDLQHRFRKTADGVFVEAKRSAIGGVTQVPLYFYGLLLALGWNEIVAVLKNPLYFIFLILTGVVAYVTYTLNLWGPMIRMANAASAQGLDIFKEKLREFLESSETGRQAVRMSGAEPESVMMDTLSSSGRKKTNTSSTLGDEDEEEGDM